MSKTVKNMSLGQITKENEAKFGNTVRVTFDGGVTLDVDQKFRETKSDKLVQELLKVMAEGMDDGKEITDGVGVTLMTAMTIKHFTSLETDSSSFDDYIVLVNTLQDGGYLNKILESFDKVEFEKLFSTITLKMNQIEDAIIKDSKINKPE
ncbi:hypothetical protein [Paenibacillus sp. FSL P4-0502]|uniref:hypothetical protein n=1 Tax=Paenibacillus sp. FSL P4-0502 TaxID=2975319 RepID=UPI0030F69825